MKSVGLGQRRLDFPNLGENLESAKRYRASKMIAYKEGFEEFEQTAVPVTILNKKYRAHPNINLYVDMTSACSADCNFCIAKVNFKREAKPVKPEWLEKTLDVCANASPSVQITGGEPTLFPKELIDLIEIMNKRRPRCPVINTYGKNLGAISELLSRSAIEHVNVSRHHYNDRSNSRIMVRNGISSDYLAESLVPIKDKVRIQCNMLAGEIDTYGEVMQFIAYCYHKLGVRNIAFAQLTPLPADSFYQASVIEEVTKAPVDVDAILERIEQDSRFEFEKYRGGVACYYEVWKFHAYECPMTVLFKYSDNYWLEKADVDPELLPDLVLHTDGTLSGSWSKDRKILCKF